jgi:phospholipase C
MPEILGQIKHVVVVMFENRSLDNLCGWLYSTGTPPSLFLPNGSATTFNGLNTTIFNPANKAYFDGAPADKVFVTQGTTSSTVPNPDPEETFDNVSQQLCGPAGCQTPPVYPMQGFIVNYDDATSADNVAQIMQAYSPGQVPVLSQLAKSYAISDAWFASVPSQTWPNRAFAHAGTSNGRVNNGEPPDPLKWNVETIFNVLTRCNISWSVYSDTILTPSLTRTMFPQLWDFHLDGQFRGFPDFEDACAKNALPAYSFIEPSFLLDPNDAHPPHDVEAAEQYLSRIWQAVSTSKGWNETLLLITFDEHGGCHDHVFPPSGAVPPDSTPGDEGFGFDRFGVRVPTILVSPYIKAGTVFRTNTAVPYDHTSILATLRDWLSIPAADMLPSKRIAAAPTVEQVLTLTTPRSDLPIVSPLNVSTTVVSNAEPLNSLQRSIVSGAARRLSLDSGATLASIKSRQQAMDFFKRHPAMAQR